MCLVVVVVPRLLVVANTTSPSRVVVVKLETMLLKLFGISTIDWTRSEPPFTVMSRFSAATSFGDRVGLGVGRSPVHSKKLAVEAVEGDPGLASVSRPFVD